MKNKKLLYALIAVLAVLAVVTAVVLYARSELYAEEITLDEAQTVIDASLEENFKNVKSQSMLKMKEMLSLKAVSLDYGSNKNIFVKCNYTGVDVEKLWADCGSSGCQLFCDGCFSGDS